MGILKSPSRESKINLVVRHWECMQAIFWLSACCGIVSDFDCSEISKSNSFRDFSSKLGHTCADLGLYPFHLMDNQELVRLNWTINATLDCTDSEYVSSPSGSISSWSWWRILKMGSTTDYSFVSLFRSACTFWIETTQFALVVLINFICILLV